MEQRPQAGPLPVKTPRLVGEIGYSEEVAPLQDVDLGDGPGDNDDDSTEGLNAAEADARNGRHPADRSHVNLSNPSTLSLPNANSSTAGTLPHTNNSTTSINSASKHTILSLRSFSSRLWGRKYAGITLKTLARFGLLVVILCGIIVAWVFAALHINKMPVAAPNPSQTSGTSSIFIHVAFTILVLLIVIFIERAIFQIRAERYAHVHPGQVLPSHRHHTGAQAFPGRSNGMAFAPWNRPPLPTYAAALGIRGTGDVEDDIIAAPPPPAYGNTRGSTLILASFLRNSLASNRSRAGDQPVGAAWHSLGRSSAGERMSGVSTRGLPVSYDEAELHSDVERARILEEALAKLEDNASRGR